LLDCEAPTTSKRLEAVQEAMKVPIFNFNPEVDCWVTEENENDSEMEKEKEVDRSYLKTLDEVLKKPDLLGEEQEMTVQMMSISKRSKQVHLIHQKMRFNDKECWILTIRDTTALKSLEKV